MVPLAHFNNEMRMQEQHYLSVIDRNASIYMEQEDRYRAEIASLKSQSPHKKDHQIELQTVLEKHSQV